MNGIFIWSYQKNVVYLHREPALGMSAHQRQRVADIIKRRLFAWFHAFFISIHGHSQEPTPLFFIQMKRKYITPSTTVIPLKSGVLCASGSPKGQLESIGKASGEW